MAFFINFFSTSAICSLMGPKIYSFMGPENYDIIVSESRLWDSSASLFIVSKLTDEVLLLLLLSSSTKRSLFVG